MFDTDEVTKGITTLCVQKIIQITTGEYFYVVGLHFKSVLTLTCENQHWCRSCLILIVLVKLHNVELFDLV